MAATLLVAEASALAGIAFLVASTAVTAGAVVGRHHYPLDAVLGASIGVIAWLVGQTL